MTVKPFSLGSRILPECVSKWPHCWFIRVAALHAISPGPLATRAASGIPEFDALLDKAKAKAPARSLVRLAAN